jgi:TRAP-type uncharacterized transport system substrate-binding protein
MNRYPRKGLWAAAAFLASAAMVFWLAVGWLHPFPPRRVTMVTGGAGSDYGELAKRYRAILARSAVTLNLVPTAGAMENLARLRNPKEKVDVGFVQGGVTSEAESPHLVSLGTVFYEPLWFFIPETFSGKTIESLRGRRISIGVEGSGGRSLSLKLLSKIGVDEHFAEFSAFPPEVAAEKLLKGEIDGATMMESWDAPAVKRLVDSGKVKLASFPRPDAYVALYPFLSKLVVPAGFGDPLTARPSEDDIVLAPKASLVVRRDLHPAIQFLLLQAARQVHSGPGIFRAPGQFPAPEAMDLPLSDEADFYYKSGQPFFQRHLPFWLAVLVERLLVILIPILGVVYPILTLLPSLSDWWFKRKVFRLYGELRFLEEDIGRGGGRERPGELVSRLEDLEQQSDRLKVPLSHSGHVYTLKEHINMVKDKLTANVARPPTEDSP